MGDMDWDSSDQDWERSFKENEEFERKHPDDPKVIRNRKWREEGKRESWRDMAVRVVAALGGLIVWSSKPRKIGEVIRRVGTGPLCAETTADQPFMVIGEATKGQWLRQLSFVGSDARGSRTRYYYFVQTD